MYISVFFENVKNILHLLIKIARNFNNLYYVFFKETLLQSAQLS